MANLTFSQQKETHKLMLGYCVVSLLIFFGLSWTIDETTHHLTPYFRNAQQILLSTFFGFLLLTELIFFMFVHGTVMLDCMQFLKRLFVADFRIQLTVHGTSGLWSEDSRHSRICVNIVQNPEYENAGKVNTCHTNTHSLRPIQSQNQCKCK